MIIGKWVTSTDEEEEKKTGRRIGLFFF